MAYISLYRKYRPQTFEDVVGQEHVTVTLRNAIQAGRVASGYLFTGTRGTAKTTCARILAKALNCIGSDGKNDSPTPEPCGVCGPCKSIAASSFVDVLEMDAASHGKVDDVRDLVASIKFPPMEGHYKVYIIDEAHQLSRDAMDAFLKTLEEPPDRVVFVLATTELDKLPITIASRCQVYEFKRGSITQIASRLTEVLKSEGVKADPAAVTLIARAADGSYRDSLSLLEQVLAFQREHVTAKDVTVVLGTIDDDLLTQVVDLIANSDAAGTFALAGTVLESGKDVRQFLKSLAERFRDMLFLSVGARPQAAGEMDDSAGVRAQAGRFAPASLLHTLEVLTAAEQETKRSNQHRLLLEMALLRLMRLPQAATAQEATGEPTPAHKFATPPDTSVMPEAQTGGGGEGQEQEYKTSPPTLLALPQYPLPRLGEQGREGVKPHPNKASASQVGSLDRVSSPEPAIPYDMPPPLAAAEIPDEEGDEAMSALLPGDDDLDTLPLIAEEEDTLPSLVIVSSAQQEQVEDLLHIQQVTAIESAPAAPPPPVPSPDVPPELVRLKRSWQEVVNRLSARPNTAAIIRDADPVALNGQTIILQFTSRFNVEKLEANARGREVVADAINRTLGEESGHFKVKGVLKGQALPSPGKPTLSSAVQNGTSPQIAPSAPSAPGPFVDEVIAVFGGQLLEEESETK